MALLVILFILVPIAELYVIITVGELIGVLPTIALLLADALLGALLLRMQGRGAWRRFNAALAERRFPGREAADGLMITVGAALLLTPVSSPTYSASFFCSPRPGRCAKNHSVATSGGVS